MIRQLWSDIRFSLRLLLKKPGFSIAILVCLVLGVGANTAVFTLHHKLFSNPLQVETPEQLAAFYIALRTDGGTYEGHIPFSWENYKNFRDGSTNTVEELVLFQWHPVNLTGNDTSARAVGTFTSGNYFSTLGIRPALGNFYSTEQDKPNESPAMTVLSHGCWTRLFGADPSVVGRTVMVNGRQLDVIGVAPQGFNGTEVGIRVDFWLPIRLYPDIGAYKDYFEVAGIGLFKVFGKLREGRSQQHAVEEMMTVARRLESENPKDMEGLGIVSMPLAQAAIRPNDRTRFLGYVNFLRAIVLTILLITFLNIANLLIVRGIERGREVAIRRAVGATPGRITAQLITETMVLFSIGGLISLPVAQWGLQLLWRFRPPAFAGQTAGMELESRMMVFSLLVTFVGGLIFGLLPALRAANPDLVSHLKENTSTVRGRAPRWWLRPRNLLVMSQIALALVALVGAGLFLRSLQRANQLDLGFKPDNLAVVTVTPGEQGYSPEQSRNYYRQAVARVEALPGVRQVALSANRLLRGSPLRRNIFLTGAEDASESPFGPFHRINSVGRGFFATTGIELLAGTDFEDHYAADYRPIAIINDTMARQLWPNRSAVGQVFHFDYAHEPAVEVVGVVADASYREVQEPAQFFVYLPESQNYSQLMTLHIRTDTEPTLLLPAVRRELQQLDTNVPLADLNSMRHFVNEALWLERTSAILLSAFGLLALVLAVVGVYAVLAYTVNQRRREFAIRMAIGARRTSLLNSVLLQGARVVLAGLALGWLLGFMILPQVVSKQLHEITPRDPKVFLALSAVLLTAALLGCLIPALRAIGARPTTVLREE